MTAPPAFANFMAALSLMNHVYFNPAIGALVRCNVPDLLDKGPMPASDLAQQTGMNELSLTRTLRALGAFGVFQEVTPGVFANNAVSDYFRTAGGLRNCALFYSSEHFLKSAAALGHSVVSGESATQRVFGESFWDHIGKHPEEGETFNLALSELRADKHRQVAEAYDWTGTNTIVDVGGGVGSMLAAILERQSGLQGVLVELPASLREAERLLSERGIRERCKLLGVSFFDSIPATGDVWAVSQVLHDWPDAECRAILTRCHEAMRPSDRLLVIEMLTVPCQPNPRVSLVDMAMLMFFGEARQRTVEEYTTLFNATGFALSRVLPTAGAFSIVEAKPI